MHQNHRRRRRAVILSSAPAAALLVGAVIVTAAGSPAADSSSAVRVGTAVATARDLTATLTADGVVENAGSSTVMYGRTSAVPDDTNATSASATAQTSTAQTAQPASLGTSADQDTDHASASGRTIDLVAYSTSADPEAAASASPTTTTAPTQSPTPAQTPTPTETATPTETPTPPTPTAPTPTVPAPTVPAPTVPAPTAEPAPTAAPPGGTVPPPQTGGPVIGAVPSGAGSAPSAGQTGGRTATAQPAKTLTGQAALGADITTGTELYTVDGEPVVAVRGDTPSWRTLKTGVQDGTDVRTLERALTDLGYGDELTVDKHFTAATARAVTDWEESLRRQDPDGEVALTEIVLVGTDSQVVDHALAIGDPVPDGSRVLTLATTKRVVTATVAADDIDAWSRNATVTVRWADGNTFTGRVSAVGREVTNTSSDVTKGTVDVTIVPTEGIIDHHTGTSANVELATQRIDEAVTVPVTALRDGPGGTPSVTVVKDGVATVRSVEVGVVTQGWAQVTTGLQPGEQVRLPGATSAESDAV